MTDHRPRPATVHRVLSLQQLVSKPKLSVGGTFSDQLHATAGDVTLRKRCLLLSSQNHMPAHKNDLSAPSLWICRGLCPVASS